MSYKGVIKHGRLAHKWCGIFGVPKDYSAVLSLTRIFLTSRIQYKIFVAALPTRGPELTVQIGHKT
jgi:hypothetical protein